MSAFTHPKSNCTISMYLLDDSRWGMSRGVVGTVTVVVDRRALEAGRHGSGLGRSRGALGVEEVTRFARDGHLSLSPLTTPSELQWLHGIYDDELFDHEQGWRERGTCSTSWAPTTHLPRPACRSS